jgi:hypothetical protein
VLLLFFRAVGWGGVVAIVVVSLVPGDARPETGLPGQIDHIVAYCGTAGLLGLGYPAAKSRFGMIAMLISLAATLEVAQRWIPGRHPQFIDFAAGVAGTCLGSSVPCVRAQRRSPRAMRCTTIAANIYSPRLCARQHGRDPVDRVRDRMVHRSAVTSHSVISGLPST